MYKEPEAMKEIHQIREQMSQEFKALSDEQIIDRVYKVAEETKKKYNLKFKQRTLTKEF